MLLNLVWCSGCPQVKTLGILVFWKYTHISNLILKESDTLLNYYICRILSVICLLTSYQENEAWGPVVGQSRQNCRFICGWGLSSTRRTLWMACQKAMRCLTKLEMLSDLMPFHHLWSTIQKNMYVNLWNTVTISTLWLLNDSTECTICGDLSWHLMLRTDYCLYCDVPHECRLLMYIMDWKLRIKLARRYDFETDNLLLKYYILYINWCFQNAYSFESFIWKPIYFSGISALNIIEHYQYILLFSIHTHYKTSNSHPVVTYTSYQYNNFEKLKLFTIFGTYLVDHVRRLGCSEKQIINNNNKKWRPIIKEGGTW